MGQPTALSEGLADPGALSADLLAGPLLGAPLLVGGLLAVALGARRWALWLARRTSDDTVKSPAEEALDERVGRWLLGLLLALAFITASTALLAAPGLLSRPVVAVASLFFALTAPRRRAPRGEPVAPARPALRGLPPGTALPWIATGTLLVFDLATRLPLVPSNWDAMGYHLYFAARWLQSGLLETVPTVFGDPSHAYAPHNGALIFAWQMALLGRDTTTNVCQLAALALLALALYRLCRLVGAEQGPAMLVALLPFWLAPLRQWTYSANVDVWLIAFGTAAIAQLLVYRANGHLHDLLAAGLAGGLAAGTKMLGLPLAGVPGLVATVLLLLHRRFAHLALYLGTALAAGGWWALRNTWRTGNPLFPLHLQLGPIELAGLYDGTALRASEFHIADRGDLLLWTSQHLGLPAVVFSLVGWLALLISARRPGHRGHALLISAAALAWWLYFLLAMPHNNQSRFLLPAVVLGLTGWGKLLSVAGRRRGLASSPAPWVLLATLCTLDARPWEAGLTLFSTSKALELPMLPWSALVFLILGVALMWHRRTLGHRSRTGHAKRRPALAFSLVALVTILLVIAADRAETSRPYTLSKEDYRLWSAGYLPLLDAPLPPLRIAYSGTSVPYALMGTGWRHSVRYVNTQGQADDELFDFWRRNPRRYPTYKPPIYRGDDEEALWLANLEHHGIDLVAIFALHFLERPLIASSPDGFPVEAAWARRRPDLFAPLLTTPAAEIYALRRGEGDDRRSDPDQP